MSLISISADDVVDYFGDLVPDYAMLYANIDFRTSEGVFVARGSLERPEFGQRFAASMNGNKIRIGTGQAYATTDADLHPEVQYQLIVFDAVGTKIKTVFAGLRIPPDNDPTDWETIQIFSTGTFQKYPSTYLDSNAILALFNNIIKGAGRANELTAGVVRLDVPATDPHDPIAVGVNSPLLTPLATDAIKGKTQLSTPADDPANPIVAGINDPRVISTITPINVAGSGTISPNAKLFGYAIARLTGVLTGNRTVNWPITEDTRQTIIFWNDTTGAFTLHVKATPEATGIELAQGALGIFVNDGANVTAIVTSSGGGGVWGAITGTLSDQTDLAAALAGKISLTGNQNVAGIKDFASSPLVPTPTTDLQVANKEYVDLFGERLFAVEFDGSPQTIDFGDYYYQLDTPLDDCFYECWIKLGTGATAGKYDWSAGHGGAHAMLRNPFNGNFTRCSVITGATNASPIVVTTATNHGLSTGAASLIRGVLGNRAANAEAPNITVLSPTTFSIDGSVGTKIVTGATNASPIEITVASHPFVTGDSITIASVGGNTAANGVFTITKTGANTFTLNGSAGNGAYTSGGTALGLYTTGGIVAGPFGVGGTGMVDFGGDDVPYEEQWAHSASGVDTLAGLVVQYYDGVPVGKVAFLGHRFCANIPGSPMRGFMGGSDHSNLIGRLAQYRIFEGNKNPHKGSVINPTIQLAAFVPEVGFGCQRLDAGTGDAINANLLVDLFQPQQIINDKSMGYPEGRPHAGRIRGTGNGFDNDRSTYPSPQFIVDNDVPNCVGGTQTPQPAGRVYTPAAVPGGALVFDSIERKNSTYSFDGLGGMGSTEGGSLGPLAWIDASPTATKHFGILNEQFVFLADGGDSFARVAIAQTNLDIRVSRKVSDSYGAGISTGIMFRYVNDLNYCFAATNGTTRANQVLYIGQVVAGAATAWTGNGNACPAAWTVLRLLTKSDGTYQVLCDATSVVSNNNAQHAAGTGAGIALHGNPAAYGLGHFGAGLRFRAKNFTVFTNP